MKWRQGRSLVGGQLGINVKQHGGLSMMLFPVHGPSRQWTWSFQCMLRKCRKNHGYKLGETDPALKTCFSSGFYCLRDCYLLYSLPVVIKAFIHSFTQSGDFSVSRDYSVSSSGDTAGPVFGNRSLPCVEPYGLRQR